MIVTSRDLINYIRCTRFAALDGQSGYSTGKMDFDERFFLAQALGEKPKEEDPAGIESGPKPEFYDWDISNRMQEHYRTLIRLRLSSLHQEPIRERVHVRYPFEAGLLLEGVLDFVIQDGENQKIFLSYPASATPFVQARYKKNKIREPLFISNKMGYLHLPRPYPDKLENPDFYKKIAKYTDRHDHGGKMVYELAFIRFIFTASHPEVQASWHLLLVNPEYVLETEKLEKEVVSVIDVTELTEILQDTIRTDLFRMINHIELNDDSRTTLVEEECNKNMEDECPFTDFCFDHVPKVNSVFSYFQQHLGFREGPFRTDPVHDTYELINNGMVDMFDVPISWLQRETNLMQRYCVENDYLYLNKKKILAKLSLLIYPLYYLDFEAYPSMLPRFLGEKCFQQSVFQFSVHMQKSRMKKWNPDELEHYEYVMPDDKDHRLEFIEKLLEAIPEGESSIVVYNQAFEDNRLQELAKAFPEHKKRLDQICFRLFDLWKVLKNDSVFYLKQGFSKAEAYTYNFYHPALSGSYSLKKVLPIFDKDSYRNLNIQDGIMAYIRFSQLPFASESERKQILSDLLLYCKQDTLSMVRILESLWKKLEK